MPASPVGSPFRRLSSSRWLSGGGWHAAAIMPVGIEHGRPGLDRRRAA
jgi:hypothetical protein